MKKFYSLVAVAALSLSVNAQVNAIGGHDFENWTEFQAGLNSYGINPDVPVSQGIGTGINNSNSLNINGTVEANSFVFTSVLPNALQNFTPKEITFWVKGTSTGTRGSLSINVYKATSGYHAYNLASITGDKIVNGTTQNDYNGQINTNGQWVKVTINLLGKTDLNLTTAGNDFFAVKMGRESNFDIQIDNIQLWDVNMNSVDLTATKAIQNTVWTNTAAFSTKGNAKVEVYNLNGQLVKSFEVNGNKSVNVSDLAAGVYVVNSTENGKTVSTKVVKK